VSYQFDDFNIEEFRKRRARNYILFLKIVGVNPMDQIDWIIENGLNKFNYWFRCYEMETIYTPATVLEEEVEYIHEVRGGMGNVILWGNSRLQREIERINENIFK